MIDSKINELKIIACRYCNATVFEIDNGIQTREPSDARKVIMFIIDKHFKLIKYRKLATILGKKERTTVYHILKKSKDLYETNKKFKEIVLSVESELNLDLNKVKHIEIFIDSKDNRVKAIDQNRNILELEQLTKEEIILYIRKSKQINNN